METNAAAPPAEKERFLTPALIIIFLIVFIDLVGFGMVIPVLPFFAEHEPYLATPFEIGMLFAVYSWMQFLFAPFLGRLSDRYGRRPVLIVSLLGSAIGYMIIGLAGSLLMVFVGRIVSGVTGANISAAQAYIADVTTTENRSKGMGLFGAAFGLGFIMGPAIAGILSRYSIHAPFYFAAALSLVSAIASLVLLPESRKPGVREPSETRKRGAISILRSERDLSIVGSIYFLAITAFSIMNYAFVLYTAYRFGYNAEQNGYLFAFIGVISAVGQGVLFGRLERRFGEVRLMVAGCFLMALSFFLMPMVGPLAGGLAALLGVGLLTAVGNAITMPSLSSLASKVAHEDTRGRALGIMQSAASLARAVGPMLGGVLLNNAVDKIDDVTLTRTFWTASLIMSGAILVSFYLLRVYKPADLSLPRDGVA